MMNSVFTMMSSMLFATGVSANGAETSSIRALQQELEQAKVRERPKHAVLHVTGNYLNTELIIDEKAPVQVDATRVVHVNGERIARFTLPRGTHGVKILREGEIIINKKVYVAKGNIFEIFVI